MRKAMVIGAMALAATLGSPAFADEFSGFRLGVGLSQDTLESDVDYFGYFDDIDTDRAGFHVFGGWALNKYFAVEAGYRDGFGRYRAYGPANGRANGWRPGAGGPPPWATARGRGGYQRTDFAFRTGFTDGYEAGLRDGRDRDRFDPIREGRYRSGDHGYNRNYGSRDFYRVRFREGFLEGYEHGFNDGWRYDARYDGRDGGRTTMRPWWWPW